MIAVTSNLGLLLIALAVAMVAWILYVILGT
jgi:hypothetical protein